MATTTTKNSAPESAHMNRNMNRRQALFQSIAGGLATATATTAVVVATTVVSPANAAVNDAAAVNAAASIADKNNKSLNLSNADLAAQLTKDVVNNQFLVTGRLSRNLYDESATFTDEIDTYGLDQWMQGTSRLFVANKSHVELAVLEGDNNNKSSSIQVSATEATFRFVETLCFNIPVLYPAVYLSGKVILKRDPSTGLITSYQEQWDQDVTTVLKSAKWFS